MAGPREGLNPMDPAQDEMSSKLLRYQNEMLGGYELVPPVVLDRGAGAELETPLRFPIASDAPPGAYGLSSYT